MGQKNSKNAPRISVSRTGVWSVDAEELFRSKRVVKVMEKMEKIQFKKPTKSVINTNSNSKQD